MKITFWKNNLLSQKHKVSVKKIISDFKKTEDSKLDLPFERLILIFMAENYGTFEVITDKQWDELYKVLRT